MEHIGKIGTSYKMLRGVIRSILANPHDLPFPSWTIQGFGMLRLYLPDTNMRLHVWDHSEGTGEVSDIHNHPWHFESLVLAGCIIDRTYHIQDGDPNPHCRVTIKCGEGGGPIPNSEEMCNLVYGAERIIRHGQSYARKADAIHRTYAEPGTVTLVMRAPLPDPDHAQVYYPQGTKWVSAEPRIASHALIQRMCEKALSIWED